MSIWKTKTVSLWSGGLDSTIATYYFSNKDNLIQPFHINIRGGGGKDYREKVAINKIYENLKDKFPNVLKPFHITHRIKPSDFRNEELVMYIKNIFDVDIIILGTHNINRDVSEDFKKDSLWEELETKSGVMIYDLRREGFKTKEDIFKLGLDLLGKDILEKTWSCQMWWKKPCGKCFSCRERKKLFKKYRKYKNESTPIDRSES